MLSQLDNILFPDRCEVLEVVPSQRYVYPIYKNGSSSLYNSGFRIVENTELQHIPIIDIYVRDPYSRLVTGINTFLQHNPSLDRTTALYFITNYLFLNRHFCPQFYWLVNLRRFSNAQIRINPIESLSEITSFQYNQSNLINNIVTTEKMQFYLSVDKVLTENLLGKTVTFKLIVNTIKHKYPEVYQEVIQRSLNLCSVLD